MEQYPQDYCLKKGEKGSPSFLRTNDGTGLECDPCRSFFHFDFMFDSRVVVFFSRGEQSSDGRLCQ